jgi:hypothetical protein
LPKVETVTASKATIAWSQLQHQPGSDVWASPEENASIPNRTAAGEIEKKYLTF